MPVNRRFALRERPTGRIDADTFELVEEELPEIGEGEALVRTEWISLDPTNRAWINDMPGYLPPVAIGETMRGLGLGRVVESKSPELRGGPARPGADRLDRELRRLRRGAAPAGAGDRGRLAQLLPRRAGDDRAHRLGRDAGNRQAAGGRDGRRLRRRRRRRLGRRASSRSSTAPASSASPAARRSARSSPTASASTPPSTTGPTTGASSSPRRPRTASTSTSRTSAARSWTRSSPASTCAPGSRSAA